MSDSIFSRGIFNNLGQQVGSFNTATGEFFRGPWPNAVGRVDNAGTLYNALGLPVGRVNELGQVVNNVGLPTHGVLDPRTPEHAALDLLHLPPAPIPPNAPDYPGLPAALPVQNAAVQERERRAGQTEEALFQFRRDHRTLFLTDDATARSWAQAHRSRCAPEQVTVFTDFAYKLLALRRENFSTNPIYLSRDADAAAWALEQMWLRRPDQLDRVRAVFPALIRLRDALSADRDDFASLAADQIWTCTPEQVERAIACAKQLRSFRDQLHLDSRRFVGWAFTQVWNRSPGQIEAARKVVHKLHEFRSGFFSGPFTLRGEHEAKLWALDEMWRRTPEQVETALKTAHKLTKLRDAIHMANSAFTPWALDEMWRRRPDEADRAVRAARLLYEFRRRYDVFHLEDADAARWALEQMWARTPEQVEKGMRIAHKLAEFTRAIRLDQREAVAWIVGHMWRHDHVDQAVRLGIKLHEFATAYSGFALDEKLAAKWTMDNLWRPVDPNATIKRARRLLELAGAHSGLNLSSAEARKWAQSVLWYTTAPEELVKQKQRR